MGASPLRLQPRRRRVPTLPSLASLLAVVVAANTACDPREPVMPETPSPPPTTSATPATTPSSSLGTVPGTVPARSRSTPKPSKFDHTDMQDAVYTMLTRHYRIDDVQLVICPPDRPVVRGTTFECTATIAGKKKSVRISVTSGKGDYVVGRPE